MPHHSSYLLPTTERTRRRNRCCAARRDYDTAKLQRAHAEYITRTPSPWKRGPVSYMNSLEAIFGELGRRRRHVYERLELCTRSPCRFPDKNRRKSGPRPDIQNGLYGSGIWRGYQGSCPIPTQRSPLLTLHCAKTLRDKGVELVRSKP